MTSCDTSFVFSLYVRNEHTERALRFMRAQRDSIHFGVLADYEFYNSLLAAEFSGSLSAHDVLLAQARYTADVRQAHIQLDSVDPEPTLQLAKDLTRRYSRRYGLRAFDVLHVACALVVDADMFLTFDRVQQKLAIAEGLKSPW